MFTSHKVPDLDYTYLLMCKFCHCRGIFIFVHWRRRFLCSSFNLILRQARFGTSLQFEGQPQAGNLEPLAWSGLVSTESTLRCVGHCQLQAKKQINSTNKYMILITHTILLCLLVTDFDPQQTFHLNTQCSFTGQPCKQRWKVRQRACDL